MLQLSNGARAGLEALADAQERLVRRTEEWSVINSGSRELAGLARMRDLLVEALATLPGEIAVTPLTPSQRVTAAGEVIDDPHGEALSVRVRPEAPIQIALTGHYDTVFPASHPFQSPQRRTDGALHGPGCADMKGGIAVMLAALETFEQTAERARVGYTVLLSPDEEIGSIGSAPLLAALGARSHLGMTYEPALASGAMVDARKGSGNFSLIVKGRAAHVGRAFGDGVNAVIAAADIAARLDALNGGREGVTFNIGAIEGGGPVNIVPDRAVVRFNVRAPDADGQAWADAAVRAIVQQGAANGAEIALHGAFTRPPKPLSPPLRTMIDWTRQAGAAIGLDLAFGPSGGVCEGNNLSAAGCPTIDTLGPCGGELHSDREFAVMKSFPERAQLSFLLLNSFAEGAFDARSLRA